MVVTHRYSQDEHRYKLRLHKPPRSVVPFARIPVIILVYPIHSVIKKEIGLHSRGVINRVARHYNKLWICGYIDSNVYVNISRC